METQQKDILHKTVRVNGVEIFYRQAGQRSQPAILLLHGFPSSSVMFTRLMNSLSDRYYLLAPDYPGFGFSAFPGVDSFDYSFDNMAGVIRGFMDALGLDKFFIYLHDYGSSIGLRICLSSPQQILGLIVQNGNAYREGLGPQWDETIDYWRHPTEEKKRRVSAFLSEEGTRAQYTEGLPGHLLPLVGPELWTLDWALMSRPGNIDMQFRLNCDFESNLAMYGQFQQYFRDQQPPALILWGKYDVFFSIEEAFCYQRDLPDSQLHILEGGHMALETNFEQVLSLITEFLTQSSSLRS
ncbi:MAG: alpha/beta hydrolase [Dyadobacter sp.]|uniref:alpha/beta fold hydrolase n=1 Tax=Dyadobacter sp. TaxID=1914288 RepID=UPI001B2BB2DC|nr:alpha/beta hydrolase [Dyadobacter sp.]MBO9611292.1 alpha/beta hydrolase [Dyadobacter sp.]